MCLTWALLMNLVMQITPATLKLKKTARSLLCCLLMASVTSQKSLAEWIEDWADYLVGFDANGDAIQATKAAAAVRKITIEANQTADFEDNDFSGKRSLMESVEAKTKDIMPVAFEFKCVPFEGLKEHAVLNYASALSLAIVLYWFCALFSWKRCRNG